MENDVYRTISKNCEGLYKEKGSKFYAFGYPVVDEDEAKQHLENLRRKYHNARHHCFAYKLGQEDNSSYRIYDDGEPSGTAGKPIFGRIVSAGLTNILIVVVRYFGGTLLGTSGLIRAYRSATEDCLKNANIVERTVDVTFRISFQYDQLNKVMHITKERGLKIHSHDYGNECKMELSIRQSNFEKISKLFLAVEELKLTIN
jgi:uncharacterized YigZ family protein